MGSLKKNNKRKQPMFDNSASKKTLHKNLEFTATEQYKLLRTNLDFTLPAGEKCAVIGVTSSMRGEGKSTTAINLSYVLAEKGNKVLLVDGDLRIPSIAKKMDVKSSPGLTDMLMGREFKESELRSNLIDTWYVLPSGEIPPNPSELLGSKRMEAFIDGLKDKFEYIVIDLPPVNLVSDALSIAGFLSGMVIVIREEYTEKKELEHCFRQLKLSGAKVLGCVMNEAKSGGASYSRYKYRKYRYYKYYYYNEYRNREDGK